MEVIIARTGFGMYNILLLVFGSACYFTNALAYMNLPLYLPLITCDVQLSDGTISAIDFAVYIGMAVGGFFLSSVSDVIGRKTIIAASLLLIFLSVLMAAFAYGPFGFIISMIFFGSGLEANCNVLKVLIFETTIKKCKYTCILCMDIAWTFGILLSLGFYWMTTPILISYNTSNQRFLNWRISILLSVFLSIILSCLTALFLESPRYLLFEKRPRDALEVFREIYAINKSKLFGTFEIIDGELTGKITDFGISNERDIPNTMSTRRLRIIFSRIHKSMLVLVRKQFIHYTILAIIFRLLLSLGQFPLILFCARCLFIDKDDMKTEKYLLWHFEHPIARDCEHFQNEIDSDLYRDYAVLSGCFLLGKCNLMILIKWMARKEIMGSSLFLSGIFSVLLGLIIDNYPLRFLFSGLLMFTYSTAHSCLDLLILEMFPTAVRSTALGETMIFSTLTNVFLIQYLSTSIFWLFITLGSLLEFGAIMAFFLPRFTNKVVAD